MKLFTLPSQDHTTDGFIEDRRALVVGLPGAIAALLTSPQNLHAAIDDAGPDRELQAFLDSSLHKALALKADAGARGQQAYIEYIDSAVASISNVSSDTLSDASWKGFDPGVFLGVSGRNTAFFVVQWRLAPAGSAPTFDTGVVAAGGRSHSRRRSVLAGLEPKCRGGQERPSPRSGQS